MESLTLTIEETAKVLGISRGMCYELARKGQLPVLRLGKRRLISKSGLNRMLENSHLEIEKPQE